MKRIRYILFNDKHIIIMIRILNYYKICNVMNNKVDECFIFVIRINRKYMLIVFNFIEMYF